MAAPLLRKRRFVLGSAEFGVMFQKVDSMQEKTSVMTQKPYQGSCLCGSIKYEVTDIEPHMAHCHCSMCRKFHGAGFSTFGEAKKENFNWIKGKHLLSSYVANNEQNDIVEFALGTLDSDISQQPDAHIFVDFKANWIELNDDLPKFKEGRENKT